MRHIRYKFIWKSFNRKRNRAGKGKDKGINRAGEGIVGPGYGSKMDC